LSCEAEQRTYFSVLGANDGIVSTASLIVGVAAAAATQHDVLVAGVAGLVAGAMSMAAGEYVSVSSQSDGVSKKEFDRLLGGRAIRQVRSGKM
jgi:VIT1/CCC1 family predicted Fe2+/Mn2+ transporter